MISVENNEGRTQKMRVLDNIFGTKHKTATPTRVSKEPKYVEVDWSGRSEEAREYIKVLNLNDFSDVEGILDYLRDRNTILILKVKPKLVQEKLELKRALKRIQRTCQAIGGDIVGVREDIIVVTPPEVEFARSEASPILPIETASEESEVVAA